MQPPAGSSPAAIYTIRGRGRGRGSSHMEDDDETSTRPSSQMLNNNSIASLLYCDEDLLVSTTPPPPPRPPPAAARSSHHHQQQQASVLLATVGYVDHPEEDHLKEHMARQRFYAPTKGYLEHLVPSPLPPEATIIPHSHSVCGARSRGVHYIIYAFGRLGLTVGTVFNAVNYLDRFLSINCHLQRWEAWMVELVSVACLSIACKLDEVNIPSLHHLQMEEVMSHSFLPATVRDMELTLLKALQWRLACVTPYSFLQLLLSLTPHTTAAAASHCTRLLLRSLTEPSFIQFDSSVIASSALRCVALLEDRHRHHHQTYGYISNLIRPDCPATATMKDEEADNGDECFRMMQTLCASCCSESDWNWNTHHHQLYNSDGLWSPVSVIRCPLELETASGGGGRLINDSRSAVSRRCLFGASASASAPQGSAELQDDDDDNTHVRDEDISHT